MDATGSLEICIENVKNNVRYFTELLDGGASNQGLVKEWRAKVVGYRDFEFDAEPLVDNPFTDDVAVLESQLAKLEPKGGGDEPESLLEGIYHVANMDQAQSGDPVKPIEKWRQAGDVQRVVIVFTDAPYKEPLENHVSKDHQ